MIKQKWFSFELWVVLLTGLWIFLIPFGKGEKVPAIMLALMGLFKLIQTKGGCTKTDAAKGFLLLIALYLIPIVLSMPDAPSLHNPLKVLMTGLGSGLAGLAIIHATAKPKVLQRITLILAAVVGFWILDAGIQAICGYDICGLSWEGGRLSGPFLKKTQMGYYAGPFSALLLMFALQRNWKRALTWALYIFTSIIVVLDNSRGGWIMYGVVSSVFIWKTLIAPQRHKFVFCAATVLLGIALLVGLYTASGTFRARADQTLMALNGGKQNIDQALTYRLQLWEAAWGVMADHPINGVGARNFRVVGEAYWPTDYDDTDINTTYPHQFIMEYWVGTGVIGLAGWMVSLGLCIRWWRRASPTQKHLAMGYGLTLAALYFPLNTHKAYYSSEMSVSIWILVALYIASILTRGTSAENEEPTGSIKNTPLSLPVNIICIHWGSAYTEKDINNLFSMIRRNTSFPICFHLFSNAELAGLSPEIIQHPEPGIDAPEEYNRYNYRKEVGLCDGNLAGLTGERVFFFDLDVLIMDNLDDLFTYPKGDQFYIINDWNTRGDHVGQATCYSFVVGTLGFVKEAFEADPEPVVQKFGTASQEYLSAQVIQRFGALNFWPAPWFQSFRYHCLPFSFLRHFLTPSLPKKETKVLAFHGYPNIQDALIGRWSTPESQKAAKGWKKLYKACRPTLWITKYWH